MPELAQVAGSVLLLKSQLPPQVGVLWAVGSVALSFSILPINAKQAVRRPTVRKYFANGLLPL